MNSFPSMLPLSKRASDQLQREAWAEAKKQARKLTGGAGQAIPLIDRYLWRGAAKRLHETTAPEVIITGPYETGKTLAALSKLHNLLATHPNAQGLMVRKTHKSLIGSAVVTWEQKIHQGKIGTPGYPVTKYGGEKPEWYDYTNGARLTVGGMDNPDKFLSAEFDFVYINQAEELELDDWEKLTGRATGRAGNTDQPQVFGDCNPGNQYHWIKQRARIQLLESRHKDNPLLYTDAGELTEQGIRTMDTLNALTGTRKKRGRDGLWVAAEGQVYEFDPEVHLIYAKDLPTFINRYRVIDFGYTNPFVCQWWGEDYDGRLYLYREIYMTKRTVTEHLPQITRYSLGEIYKTTLSDHDAEDRATLEKGTVILKENGEAWMSKLEKDNQGNYIIPGVKTANANKSITTGIEAVRERLKVQPDGKPRLYVVRDCLVELDISLEERYKPTCTEKEFPGYVYPPSKGDKADKEDPVKMDDHGMDTTRYLVAHVDISPNPSPAGTQVEFSRDDYIPERKSLWQR